MKEGRDIQGRLLYDIWKFPSFHPLWHSLALPLSEVHSEVSVLNIEFWNYLAAWCLIFFNAAFRTLFENSDKVFSGLLHIWV